MARKVFHKFVTLEVYVDEGLSPEQTEEEVQTFKRRLREGLESSDWSTGLCSNGLLSGYIQGGDDAEDTRES